MSKKKILITGCAGFIGSQFAKKCSKKYFVIGIDNLDNYYSVAYKKKRISEIKKNKNFKFFKLDKKNQKKLSKIISKHKISYVFHLLLKLV